MKTKFARDGSGSKPSERSSPASRSRSSTTSLTSGGLRSAATASAAESVETGAGDWRRRSSAAISGARERVPDARARERERLRERADHDDVLVLDQPRRRLAGVLEVRLVHGERPRIGERPELAERIPRPARKRQTPASRLRLSAPASSAPSRKSGYVGSVGIATVSPGPANARATRRIRSSAPGAEHDVLRLDARVPRDRRLERGVAAVRIRVDLRERRRERARP